MTESYDWTVKRSEFKGHPMLSFRMATERYPDARDWGFGVAKAVKVLDDIGELVAFVREHGKPDDVERLHNLLSLLSGDHNTPEATPPGPATEADPVTGERYPEGKDAANPSFPAGVDEGGNPFA